LAGDISRHLAGLPVRARADSLWYRGTKFVRRNRIAVAAAALIALTLVGGIVATAWQASHARVQAELARAAQARAEHRFAEVRKLANAVLFEYHDAIKDLPGATPVRERLVRDALLYLNSLAAEGGADQSLKRELALAYRKVAEVQGGLIGGAGLGDTSGAIDSARKSMAILEALLAAAPDDGRAKKDVADGSLQLAGLMSVTEDQAEALKLARRARSLYEPIIAASAPTLDQRLALSMTYDVIGTIALESGQPTEALEMYRRQREVLESASSSEQRRPDVRRSLSVAYQHQADAEGTFGNQQAALESYRRSLQIREALSSEFPHNADYRALVANGHYWVGTTLAALGRPREALGEFQRSLQIGEELTAADPRGHNVTFGVARIGDMLSQLGDHTRALGYYRRARGLFAIEAGKDPDNLWKRGGLIEAHASMCATMARLARHDEVLPACAETSTLIEQTPVEPTNAVIRASLARSYVTMARGLTWLAAQPGTSREQSVAYQRSARDMLQQSAAIWADMSRLAMLTSADDAEAATVARALRDAEAGLVRLTKAN
jgi:non-specific serine/threonine protein kinase/serine/threonine-protein kinase